MKTQRIAVLVMALLIYGCSSLQSLDISKRTHTYNAPYDRVYQAASEYCLIGGFAIVSGDTKSGILTTDYKESTAAQAFFLGGAQRMKLSFSLREIRPEETRVVLTMSYEQEGAFGQYKQAGVTEGEAEEAYQRVFSGIQTILSGGAL